MTFVSSYLLLILLLPIESISLSGSVLLRYIAPIQDHIRQLVSFLTVLVLRKSDFCFSAGLPFPLYSTGTAELRCCYKKYISYLLVMRYIMLQEKCSVLIVWRWWSLFFIQLMCYYLTSFLSSFKIIFLIIFEPRFICWLEILVKSLQH